MTLTPDPWEALKRFTGARIALGRAGGSLPTRAWLDFKLAHARARDAVWHSLDAQALARAAAKLGVQIIEVRSQASDHATFLRRPDLGRLLGDGEAARLAETIGRAGGAGAPDLAIIASGGLSATALEAQVPPLLAELLPLLRERGVSVSPLV